jgi:hypothetical protein
VINKEKVLSKEEPQMALNKVLSKVPNKVLNKVLNKVRNKEELQKVLSKEEKVLNKVPNKEEQLMLLLPQPIPRPRRVLLLKEPHRVAQVLVHSHPARTALLLVAVMVSPLVELLKEDREL